MKIIATLQADLDGTPLGTRSRLADELCGIPVLRRTVERVQAIRRVEKIFVMCPEAQQDRCTRLLDGTAAQVLAVRTDPPRWATLVQAARKWSLEGWRGGIGGATFFDEFIDCRVLAGLLETVDSDLVLAVPPAGALFDPALADRMIEHKIELRDEFRLVFSQTPPGLSGVVMESGLIRELAESLSPIGWAFAYQPDTPKKDLILESCCFEVPRELRHAVGRVSADTDRSTATVHQWLQDHDATDASEVGRWLIERKSDWVEPVPHEVEIELTTDDPYPDAVLRPRGSRIEARGPIDPAIVEHVAEWISHYDDALLILGGFGDPLRHPTFDSVLKAAAQCYSSDRRVYGLAVRTTAVDLTDEQIELMIKCRVDVLSIILDAWTGESYARLQSPRDPDSAKLDAILAKIDRVAEIRQSLDSPFPIVLPEFTKARENADELDDFHDGWIRRLGAVMIGAAGPYAGQFEDHRMIDMSPPARFACRRIASRCCVLADGRVTPCDQDMHGRFVMGRLPDQSLEEIWQGEAFSSLRTAHTKGRFDVSPICAACTEWHRP
ncbi:MAG: SPASM domain-containing protein [Planctomycetes bacterium]|nr:SPASM domain-containing protein [Planctomycetota bacterium]